MTLKAYIEADPASDFAPLSFYKKITAQELQLIRDIRGQLTGPVKSATFEAELSAACCTGGTESRLLVAQDITVFPDHIVIAVSDPLHEVEFNSRPISHEELDKAVERSAKPGHSDIVFLGFNEDTGVLADLLDGEYGDRDDRPPASDRLLTANQLALVYGNDGEHATLKRSKFENTANKGGVTYWQWLESHLSDNQEVIASLRKELEPLEAAFEHAGGRGVELAEEIDDLRNQIEALESCEQPQIEIPEDERGLAMPPSDRNLTAEQLAERYSEAGEHGAFPQSEWRDETANEGTTASYWTWLEGRVQLLDDEEVEEINSSIGSCSELNGPGY